MTELICIVCPKGCHLHVDEANDYAITGNGCPRGEAYGRKELTNPTRTLTSIVKIANAPLPCCSVKTSSDIPKEKIPEAMALLRSVKLVAPVSIGDVIVENVCGCGVDWIATKNLAAVY